MRSDAERTGIHTIRIEAPENKSLPALLAPQLRLALLRLRHVEAAKSLATKGLRALAGFAKALKIKYEDIEVGLDFEPEAGLADKGDLEGDLTSLLETGWCCGKGCRNSCRPVYRWIAIHQGRSVCCTYLRITSLRTGSIAGDGP